jgi:hypothetical protein
LAAAGAAGADSALYLRKPSEERREIKAMSSTSFDHTRIDITNPEQLRQCAEHFGISEDDVRQAVNAAGPGILDVEAWLSDHAKI